MLVVDALQGQTFGPVSFTLTTGEVVGIAGAEGNGQPQLFDCLAGAAPAAGRPGGLRRQGAVVDLDPRGGGAGIMLLPGDRKREALMGVLGREGERHGAIVAALRRLGWLRRRASGAPSATSSSSSRSAPRRSSSRSSSCPEATSRRSRCRASFLREPSVILAYEPTQGVDVGSRFDIYKALAHPRRRRGGAARQVERPDRALGAVRPGARDVAGHDRRGDPGDELDEVRIVEAIVRGPGMSKAGRSPLGVAMPKAPLANGGS